MTLMETFSSLSAPDGEERTEVYTEFKSIIILCMQPMDTNMHVTADT